MESYKKLVLVSLLADGHVSDLPKYTSMMMRHRLDNFIQPYKHLATQFEQKDDNQFMGSVEKLQEEILKDGNLGLLKRVLKVY